MLPKWMHRLIHGPDFPAPPPDTITTDEEREAFEKREREIELRLRWIRYQADQLSRMEQEHEEITDDQEHGDDK